MAANDLTRVLLLEEVAEPRAVAEALFASVSGGVPLLQALVDSGAASPEVLGRYLARVETPFLRHVVPVPELVDQLPRGLCARLLAIPVRRDAITGTVDVVVADPSDPHPASEVAFHLGASVRVVRAPVEAIEEALRRLRIRWREDLPADRFNEAAARATGATDDPAMFDSRRPLTLPPPEPALSQAVPSERDLPPRRGGLVIEADSAPPPPVSPPNLRLRTPPWGTPVHSARPPASDGPRSGLGSEIPIPLTRKTFYPGRLSGGTQRPPPLLDPRASGLGEGYAFDATNLRDAVEKTAPARVESAPPMRLELPAPAPPLRSFIPGPPPLPGMSGSFVAYAPQLPSSPAPAQALGLPELDGVLSALRNAGSRDEILELILTGARMAALKVALFVVKKGGYLGWVGTPEFSDRSGLQSVLIPLEASSIFDRAVREDLYLGPIRNDEVHAPLLRVMRTPSRDVAAVPVRVSGKTAVIIVADELGDTMIGTRRLVELARAAGEAFGRIVRTRR